jgi:hypothetical protein
LRAPLTGIVGDLVTDFVADQCHGSVEMLWGGGSVTSRLRGKGSGGNCPSSLPLLNIVWHGLRVRSTRSVPVQKVAQGGWSGGAEAL